MELSIYHMEIPFIVWNFNSNFFEKIQKFIQIFQNYNIKIAYNFRRMTRILNTSSDFPYLNYFFTYKHTNKKTTSIHYYIDYYVFTIFKSCGSNCPHYPNGYRASVCKSCGLRNWYLNFACIRRRGC